MKVFQSETPTSTIRRRWTSKIRGVEYGKVLHGLYLLALANESGNIEICRYDWIQMSTFTISSITSERKIHQN